MAVSDLEKGEKDLELSARQSEKSNHKGCSSEKSNHKERRSSHSESSQQSKRAKKIIKKLRGASMFQKLNFDAGNESYSE